jgi:hypothetical protein
MKPNIHPWKALSSMRVLLRALVLVMLAAHMIPATVAAETNGTISGTVINGTNGEPVSNIDVVLSRFASQSPDSVDISTTADDEGRFTFTDLDTSPGLVYAASVRHQRVLYSSGMLRFDREPTLATTLTVFDPTRDESVVEVQARGLIITDINGADGIVSVADAYILHNGSTYTFIGDDEGRSIRFTVPENTLEVTPLPGFDFSGVTLVDDVIHTSTPLRPGTVSATLQYQIPYSGTSLAIPLRADYPTSLLRVLLPVDDSTDPVTIAAQGTTLVDQGVVEIEGRPYHVWLAGQQSRGATLTLTMSNLPRTLVEPNVLRTKEPALLALLVVLLASGLTSAVVYRRGLHRPRPVTLAPAAAGSLDARREELSTELRALEDAWQAGTLDAAAYRAARRHILEGLRSISRQYRGLGDDE